MGTTGGRSAHFTVGHLFYLSLPLSTSHCAMVRTLTLTNPTATIHRHIDRLHTTGARVLLTHTYRERKGTEYDNGAEEADDDNDGCLVGCLCIGNLCHCNEYHPDQPCTEKTQSVGR